jgi:hypothetical protein
VDDGALSPREQSRAERMRSWERTKRKQAKGTKRETYVSMFRGGTTLANLLITLAE